MCNITRTEWRAGNDLFFFEKLLEDDLSCFYNGNNYFFPFGTFCVQHCVWLKRFICMFMFMCESIAWHMLVKPRWIFIDDRAGFLHCDNTFNWSLTHYHKKKQAALDALNRLTLNCCSPSTDSVLLSVEYSRACKRDVYVLFLLAEHSLNKI